MSDIEKIKFLRENSQENKEFIQVYDNALNLKYYKTVDNIKIDDLTIGELLTNLTDDLNLLKTKNEKLENKVKELEGLIEQLLRGLNLR
jgi:hypothetical protein